MRSSLPWLSARTVRVVCATIIAIALAVSATIAQFGTFDPAFDGELWGVRHELTPADGGVPAGVAYSNGTLFVVDSANDAVLAYDSAGHLVPTANHDWNAGDSSSPVFGFSPNQLFATSIDVDGTPQSALLVSDEETNRVAAFDTTGHYLFTLRLHRPSDADLYSLSIGQLAMSPGATFSFTTSTQTLALTGSFAAAWFEQIAAGPVDSGAMVFQGPLSFPVVGSEFDATPTVIKRGNEHDPIEPAPRMVFGVVFDQVGNLYVLDAFNERLHVYGPALNHLFSFGTPVADGTSAEFHEPWGLAFWPDAAGTGGRLFINDTYKSRIMVYRPFDGPDSDADIEGMQIESVIKDFLPPHPAIFLFGIALDPASGSIAVTDFAEEAGAYPRAVVLQQPRLAAFNLQLLDADGGVVQSVCLGAPYKIRFSLTVPSGRDPVNNVVPQLLIDGAPAPAAAIAADSYPSPMTLSTGEVATYAYALTAPDDATADIAVVAGATASNTSDISARAGTLFVADCAGETDPSTITATPSTPPQVSGWTPVFEGDAFTVTLTAHDEDGIDGIEYQLEGANESGEDAIATDFDGAVTDAVVEVPIADPGRTTLTYRVRDGNAIWSAWHTLNVRTKLVVDRQTNENSDVQFQVGDPEGVGISFSVEGLPAGVTFSTTTGQFGGVVSFDANDPYSPDPLVASGVHNVVVTETASGGATSSVSFTWTVNNINRHPTITPILPSAIPAIVEGQDFQIDVDGHDPDHDKVFFTFNGHSPLGYDLPPTVTIDPATGKISGTFPLDSQPSYTITVGLSECAGSANDDPVVCVGTPPRSGLATLMEITVSITNVNQPPAVNNPGPQSNTEGQTITPLQIAASDPDLDRGDLLTFIASNLPPGLAIDAATGLISGTVGYVTVPSYAVIVKVKDLAAVEPAPSVTFNWAISEAPPTVTAFSDRTSFEGDSFNTTPLQTDASDPGGAALTFTATGLPHGLSIDAVTGRITGTIAFDAAGAHLITITVSRAGVSASISFHWTVIERNSAPTITAADRTNAEGAVIAPTLVAPGSDAEGDALTYVGTGLPTGLTMLGNGLVSGTIGATAQGSYPVSVTVSDGADSATAHFTWTVTNVNEAPTVSSPNRESNENETIGVTITHADVDGDALTFSVTGLPAGFTINSAGLLSGTFSYESAGAYTVTVTAFDGTLSASTTFTWKVNNVNRPPVLNVGDRHSVEGDAISVAIDGTDPDHDALTFSMNGLPPSLTIAPATGVISGTFAANSAGVYTVNVGVVDSALGVVKSFQWTVSRAPSNVPPICTAASASPGALWPPNHKPVSIAIGGVVDPDGGTPAIRFTSVLQDEPTNTTGDGNTTQDAGIENNGASVWVRAERMGDESSSVYGRVYIVGFTATDAAGASCSGSVLVGVPHDQGNGSMPIPSAGRWNSITGALVVAPPPVANDDSVSVKKSTQQVVTVQSNDVVYGPVALSIASAPASGTVTVNADGTVTYKPVANWTGTTSFSYRLTNAAGSDTAIVTVKVK